MESLIIDFARENNEKEAINLIDNEKTSVNVEDKDGYNLLMISLLRGLEDLSLKLIERNINLKHQDSKGQTILHHLAIFYNEKILLKCLEEGADLSISDIYGNQSLWTTVFNDKGYGKRLEMIKILMEYGADPYHKNNVEKSPYDMARITKNNEVKSIFENYK
ncbi:ankyrin repeat domain-containing protein [Galbibacter sp. BG1]|uniref:ankyrin repeat domain-containing protein n=1 Tax=Galbibacter sp. BG1 TaxID=1170699 RepID=UPI0015B91289|nr:ankyrin repeat domain-containing protein [Galbibacter sp. BG1]QLE02544.1 ankyrin repeat domain-containing protein [Galbibacter sp. BG1]